MIHAAGKLIVGGEMTDILGDAGHQARALSDTGLRGVWGDDGADRCQVDTTGSRWATPPIEFAILIGYNPFGHGSRLTRPRRTMSGSPLDKDHV